MSKRKCKVCKKPFEAYAINGGLTISRICKDCIRTYRIGKGRKLDEKDKQKDT